MSWTRGLLLSHRGELGHWSAWFCAHGTGVHTSPECRPLSLECHCGSGPHGWSPAQSGRASSVPWTDPAALPEHLLACSCCDLPILHPYRAVESLSVLAPHLLGIAQGFSSCFVLCLCGSCPNASPVWLLHGAVAHHGGACVPCSWLGGVVYSVLGAGRSPSPVPYQGAQVRPAVVGTLVGHRATMWLLLYIFVCNGFAKPAR